MAKKQKSPHAGTPALVALEKAGVPHTVHPYEHDPASDLVSLTGAVTAPIARD